MEVMIDERTLTELDHARLEKLIVRHDDEARTSPLLAVLEAAHCVPSREVEPDVVTMGSKVLLLNLDSLERMSLTLCYPPEARPSAGYVSVLSPLGAALLGRRIGEVARWRTPDGGEGVAQVVTLLYQPEAAGQYTL